MLNIENVIQENKRRNAELDSFYDPLKGIGSPLERFRFNYPDAGIDVNLPSSMRYDKITSHILQYKTFSQAASAYGVPEHELFEQFVRERFKHDFEFWAAVTIIILHKDLFKPFKFRLRKVQRKLLYEMEMMRLAGVPIRIVLLKARQWGGSTLVQMYMFWIQQIHRTNWHLAIVAQDDNAAKNISSMYHTAAENYPKDIASITFKSFNRSSKNIKCVERKGIIGVGSFNNPDQFRSYNYAMVHLCIHPNTEIPTKNGFTKLAKDICYGDTVITHTGEVATVSHSTISKPGIRNGNGTAYKIKAWGQQEITVTPNHPLFTKRGWIQASELTYIDLLSYPVRKITNSINYIQLPVFVNKRKQGGGTIPMGSGKKLILNHETGFALGYYLAEGSIHRRKDGSINEITFSRHDKELAYPERALKALEHISTKTKRQNIKGCKTTRDFLNDSILATWLYETIGMKEFKTIPDWFFDCGEDFLRGVLIGYLCGDGAKDNGIQGNYVLSAVSSTSISQSITFQIRDIAVALGYGMASLDIRKKGLWYGRNCKQIYILRWAGSSARKLRHDLGWEYPDNGRLCSEKSFIEDGFVWMKVKSIIETEIDLVVDIEVDHPDHSFRTISCSVKNSEVGIWQDTTKRTAANLVASLKETVPDQPYTVVVEESTAKGLNYFYESWKKAVSGKTRYKAVFVAWYEIDRCRVPLDIPVDEFVKSFSDYDLYLWKLGATLEGINWYRKHKADKNYSDVDMQNENPSTPEEAFSSSGQKVFPPSYVLALRKFCKKPILEGEVYGKTRIGEFALEEIRFEKISKGNLKVWKMPDDVKNTPIKNRYCGFLDIGGTTSKADNSVFTLLDREPMIYGNPPEVACSWTGHLDSDMVVYKAAQICMAYSFPEIGEYPLLAVEIQSLKTESSEGNHSLTALDNLKDIYPNLYVRNDHEKIGDEFVPKYGFHTNVKTKSLIIDALKSAAREMLMAETDEQNGWGYLEFEDEACDEMTWYEVKPDGSLGAIKGKRDDRVMSRAGSVWLGISHMEMPFIIKEVIKSTPKVRGYSSY